MKDYTYQFIYGEDEHTGTALPLGVKQEPRFKHHDFKHGVSGSLQFTNVFEGTQRNIFVQVFIHADRQNSTVMPSAKNVSIHPFTVNKYGKTPINMYEELAYDGWAWHKALQLQVLEIIESRVEDNMEMLNNFEEY